MLQFFIYVAIVLITSLITYVFSVKYVEKQMERKYSKKFQDFIQLNENPKVSQVNEEQKKAYCRYEDDPDYIPLRERK